MGYDIDYQAWIPNSNCQDQDQAFHLLKTKTKTNTEQNVNCQLDVLVAKCSSVYCYNTMSYL